MSLKCLKPPLASSNPSGWKPDAIRGNRHQRGYGREWEITRKRIMMRDHGLCQPHLERGEVQVGNQVDHKVGKATARAMGWTNDQIEADSNLQTICDACHKAKTARESQGGAG